PVFEHACLPMHERAKILEDTGSPAVGHRACSTDGRRSAGMWQRGTPGPRCQRTGTTYLILALKRPLVMVMLAPPPIEGTRVAVKVPSVISPAFFPTEVAMMVQLPWLMLAT